MDNKTILKIGLLVLFGVNFAFTQAKVKYFFVVEKCMYVNLAENTNRIKVPFKEKEMFYFSIKNDTTAIIQDIIDNKQGEIKEYKISQKNDTVYIKRYSLIGDKQKTKIEKKVIFRKVY